MYLLLQAEGRLLVFAFSSTAANADAVIKGKDHLKPSSFASFAALGSFSIALANVFVSSNLVGPKLCKLFPITVKVASFRVLL